MSEWITDRLPDPDDAPEDWVFVMNHGNVVLYLAVSVELGMPWHPIVPPAPYVKPKRWTVEWHDPTKCWRVIDTYAVMGYLHLDSSQAEAAQRICDIYNEVMP
jgi:hypothetical protein